MLHSFSFGELALVFGIVIVLFGGSRLASVGKSLGEGIANFKKGLSSANEEKNKVENSEGHQVKAVNNMQIAAKQNVTNEQVVDVVENKNI